MTGPDTASQRIRAWINPGIVALLAASFWPFANFINQNRGSYFSLNWILIYFAMVAAIFICLTAVIGALTRKPFARVAAPFAAFIVLFFCYGAMRQAIPGPPKFIIYIWLAIVVLACALAWLASRHQKASAALLAALLVLVALPTASYLKFIAGTLAAARAQAHLYPAALVRKPNIYFMILDAYARADTLKEALGFDNQPFIDEVRKLGFFVPERSVSNYPATNLSVSSILSLDYLEAALSLDREVQFRRELLGHNVVVEKLKAEGYRYIVVPSGIWTKISCGGQEDVCIEKTRALEMERALLSLTPLRLISEKTAFRKLLRSSAEDYLEPRDLLGPLADPLAGTPSPFFALIHFGGIHDQIYTADCAKGTTGSVTLRNRELADRYTYAVHCTNEQLLLVLKTIIARDPNAVVVMTGDHGPYIVLDHPWDPTRLWGIHSREEYRNQYGTMTGIRLPASCRGLLSDDHYAVNDFRIVFACLSDSKPALLANQAYYFYPDEKRVEPIAPEFMK